jgi:CheY-like chemotaxis protein
MSQSAPPILLIEDSPEDHEVTVRAFKKMSVANPIYRCADGDEALDFLYRRGRYRSADSAPRPALILLDLNLPGTDGREVLMEIKSDADLKIIPVVILTTSGDERDVQRSYAAGANAYMQKPVSLDEFMRVIERIRDYWLTGVTLPRDQGRVTSGEK